MTVDGGWRRALQCAAAVLLAALLAAGPAAAMRDKGPKAQTGYDIGLAAYKSKQYDQAIDIWTRYAVAGDVRCQHALGDVYSNVEFTARDDRDEKPTVVQLDNVAALKWYTIAANYDFETRRNLEGREPSPEEVNASIMANQRLPKVRADMTDGEVRDAEQLVSETFQRGSPYDLFRLGQMHQSGSGVEKNNTQALVMYTLAEQRGVGAASHAGARVEQLMNPKQIRAANELVSVWQPPLPIEHTMPTKQQLELERLKRELEEIRLEDALKAISDIDVKLIQRALRALGFYFGEVDNVMGPGTQEAIRRFQYSSVEKDAEMPEKDKQALRTGVLTPRQTVDLFARASAPPASHPMSQYVYGVMHVRGIGVQQDGAAAVNWLSKAAEADLSIANYALGVVYRDGTTGLNEVAPNKTLSAQYFAKSCSLGYRAACEALKRLEFTAPRNVE
ncbi:MAG: peptidoglycan-binding protein [Amphiplicatus sp.]